MGVLTNLLVLRPEQIMMLHFEPASPNLVLEKVTV